MHRLAPALLLGLLAACSGAQGPSGGPAPADLTLAQLAMAGEGWTRDLDADAVGGIDSCLSRVRNTPAVVLLASEYQPGFTAVTLRESDLRIFTCIGRTDGEFVVEYRPLPGGGAVAPGPIFTRGHDSAPSGRCYETRRVVDGEGRLIGRISTDRC